MNSLYIYNMEKENKNFLEFLRGLNKSNYEIAQKCGVETATVGRWLKGESQPRRRNVVALAETFGYQVTFDENNVPNFQPLDPYEQKMFNYKHAKRIPEQAVHEPIELLQYEKASLEKTVKRLLDENHELKEQYNKLKYFLKEIKDRAQEFE